MVLLLLLLLLLLLVLGRMRIGIGVVVVVFPGGRVLGVHWVAAQGRLLLVLMLGLVVVPVWIHAIALRLRSRHRVRSALNEYTAIHLLLQSKLIQPRMKLYKVQIELAYSSIYVDTW